MGLVNALSLLVQEAKVKHMQPETEKASSQVF
jgi:hypothetical protein